MSEETGFFIVEDTLSANLDHTDAEIMAEVESHAVELAVRILEYAKQNAPWDDRTGDARRMLDVDVEQDAETIVIQLYHQVEYGLWLELIQSGRFAIIMPTLEKFADEAFTIEQPEEG